MLISDLISKFRLNDDITFRSVYKSNPEYDNLEIHVVALTGGPCGGKTTVVNLIKEKSLLMSGFQVFVANEAAENLISNHINFMNVGADQTFQREVIISQLTAEKNAVISAIKYKINNPYDFVFCIFDRSIMDGQAYFDDPMEYEQIIKDYGFDTDMVYSRIDRVIFMQSTANGAEDKYELNGIRTEPLKEAKKRDNKVRKAWEKHPNFCPILNKNYSDFNEKARDAVKKVFELIAVNITGRYKVSFVVHKNSIAKDNKKLLSIVNSKVVFLKTSDDRVEELRFIATENGNLLQHVTRSGVDVGGMVFKSGTLCDVVKTLKTEDFLEYANRINTEIPVLKKVTYAFSTKKYYYEYTEYNREWDGALLTVYYNSASDNIEKIAKAFEKVFYIVNPAKNEVNYFDYNIAISGNNYSDN